MKKVLLAALLSASSLANAALINNNDGTFTDTVTGYAWQDISTFFNVSTSQMSGKLLSGFHFASLEELTTLQVAAPAVAANFASDASAMGVPLVTVLNRSLIWGVYGDLSNYTWKWSSDNFQSWNFSYNSNTSYPDMGAFAVNTAAVPEPASIAMFGLGLLALATSRREAAKK